MGSKKRFAATLVTSSLFLAMFAMAAAPAHASDSYGCPYPSSFSSRSHAATTSSTTDESQFTSDTNYERGRHGLSTLVTESDLVAAARKHSQDMANKGTIWHDPNTPYTISGWTVYGENVGMGPDEQSIQTAFMQSQEHCDNVLDGEFNQIGVGVVVKDGTVYVTLIFVKRNSSPPAPTYTSSYTPPATHYVPVAAVNAAKPKPARPAPAKPATPVVQPRTVSLLVQLVGLDAEAVNPATGQALGV
jgi:uncharacterized protein YkwD